MRARDLVGTAGDVAIDLAVAPVVAKAQEDRGPTMYCTVHRDVYAVESGHFILATGECTVEDGWMGDRLATVGEIGEFARETGKTFDEADRLLSTFPHDEAVRLWLQRRPA